MNSLSIMSRKWVYHSSIRTFFWEREHEKRMDHYKLANDADLMEWCQKYNCIVHYTWVECPDDETVLLFLLRWA